jgi:hypothetical protein
MSKKILFAGALLVALAPVGAFAQSGGAAAGATTGAVGGAIVGGLADQQQPRFRQYVVTQGVPSYRYTEEVRVGATLPASGVQYYEVPAEYGVSNYRYTVVNDTPVLVEPGTRRIVQIVR